jgi:hypothetical protein
MNSAEVSILKQSNKISLSSFLKSRNSAALKAEIGFEILSDFTNKTLEWKFPDEKLCALLVLADFTKSDCSWSETVRLLHSSGGWC